MLSDKSSSSSKSSSSNVRPMSGFGRATSGSAASSSCAKIEPKVKNTFNNITLKRQGRRDQGEETKMLTKCALWRQRLLLSAAPYQTHPSSSCCSISQQIIKHTG